MHVRDQIDNLFKMSDDELWMTIGNSAISAGIHKSILPESDALKAGKLWFDLNRDAIRTRVCGSWVAALLSQGGDSQQIELTFLAAAIADLIAGACLGVSPLTVAVMITRLGIKSLCDGGAK